MAAKDVSGSTETGRWRWYHGVGFYGTVQVLGFGLSRLASAARRTRPQTSNRQEQNYFRDLNQSVFAPPAEAFLPIWILNNIFCIWGLLRVLNMPRETPGRRAFLGLQAASWLNLAVWSAAYFAVRSPINGFVLTALFLGLTILSMFVALFHVRDGKTALSLVTLLVWLMLATPIALLQMLWNRDEFYGVGSFTESNPKWIKRGTGIRRGS